MDKKNLICICRYCGKAFLSYLPCSFGKQECTAGYLKFTGTKEVSPRVYQKPASKLITFSFLGYPGAEEFQIQVDIPLPPFEYGCRVRTWLAWAAIMASSGYVRDRIEAGADFIVETVEKTKTGEHWELGT